MRRHGKITRTRYDPNEFIVEDNKVYITLFTAKGIPKDISIVSLIDFDIVKKYKWSCTSIRGNKYVVAYVNKKYCYLHRLIMNAPKGLFVDHINHNTLDNRRENLRICTNAQNIQGQKLRKDNKSGVKGVSWDSSRKKWKSEIQINKKYIDLGSFNCFNEAVKARTKAAKSLFGEYAYMEGISNESN